MQDSSQPINRIRSIRERLGLSQSELGEILGCTQGNIGHYEVRSQVVPPQVAQHLIVECAIRGLRITYEDIYGSVEALWAQAEVVKMMARNQKEENT